MVMMVDEEPTCDYHYIHNDALDALPQLRERLERQGRRKWGEVYSSQEDYDLEYIMDTLLIGGWWVVSTRGATCCAAPLPPTGGVVTRVIMCVDTL